MRLARVSAEPLDREARVKRRAHAYSVIALAAAVLSLLPGVLWMDFVAPYSAYEVWQRTEKDITFRLSDQAVNLGELDAEIYIFKVLVAPTVLSTYLGVPRPEYTRFAFPDQTIVELAGVQPSKLALQYFLVAFPTWLVLFGVCYELTHLARRRHAV